jgi:hypothetical protein
MKQKIIRLPWKPTDVWYIGDLQWSGNRNSMALDRLTQTIKDALEAEKHGRTVRFIGMGDYIDFASPSNRARLKSANLYDTASDVIDDKALDLTHEIYKLALEPTKGKWLGMVEGHHFHELKDGTTTDMRLCEMLGAEFFGTTGLINLQFMRQSKGHQQIGCTIWFAHGTGNGQTGYYPIMRLEKKAAEWEQVDVLAMGHTSKCALEFQNKVYPRWQVRGAPDLSHRKVILIGSGGYSKTYVEGAMQGRVPRGGYAEQRMLNAAIIGSPVLHIRPRQSGSRVWLDITGEG